MRDRSGNTYVPITQTVTIGGRARQVLVGFASPARQAKKASGRTGRQWRKWLKAQRHIAKYEQSLRPVGGVEQ